MRNEPREHQKTERIVTPPAYVRVTLHTGECFTVADPTLIPQAVRARGGCWPLSIIRQEWVDEEDV